MSIYTQPNFSGGIDGAIINTATTINDTNGGLFTGMFLLFIYGTILISGMVSQRRRVGTSDVPLWATLAGIGTLMFSLLLSLGQGLIQVQTLAVVIFITIASGFWLFMDRNRNEV